MNKYDDQLRKLSDDELIDRAIEEAAEIVVAIIKCKRFGLTDYHPERPWSDNCSELIEEIYQLSCIGRILGARYSIKYGDIADKVQNKRRLTPEDR